MCWLHKRRRNRHKDKGVRTMSLMGYTETDVFKMMNNLHKAHALIEDEQVKINLIDTATFLEGLLEEGRI